MRKQTNAAIAIPALVLGISFTCVTASLADDLVISDTTPALIFNDTTADDGSEWVVRGRDEFFAIVNSMDDVDVFRIEPGADTENAMVIGSTGSIGLGTPGPMANLHIAGGALPAIRLEQTNALGLPPAYWLVRAGHQSFTILGPDSNGLGLTLPFAIDAGAPTGSFEIDSSGRIGLGTSSPQFNLEVTDDGPTLALSDEGERVVLEHSNDSLHIKGADAQAISRIHNLAPFNSLVISQNGEMGIGTPGPRATLHMQDSNPGIRFEDNASGTNVMELELSNNFLRIKGGSGQDLGKINAAAPVGTFTTDAKGRTGYGTANPAASFNVKYRSAHGAVPVMLIQRPNNDEIFKVEFDGDTFVGGALVHSSDRNAKTAIQPVDTAKILQKVTELPIHQWQYKASGGINHLGPMAQDFKAAFNLGDTDTGIATVDLDGVALASIQALAVRDREISMENQRLRDENLQLKQAHRELLSTLNAELDRNMQQQAAIEQQSVEIAALQADRERLHRLEAVVAGLAAGRTDPVMTASR